MTLSGTLSFLSILVILSRASVAGAQILPSSPIVIGDGTVTLGGDISASVGRDDPGFFNYTDYQHSVDSVSVAQASRSLRRFRADLNGLLKAGNHVSVLGELRLVDVDDIVAAEGSALYLRIHPWTSRRFDIQAGRIPPTFGAFTHRTYGSDNPLIGYPLGFQYLTSLRPDAIPADADELLKMRGRGWLDTFSVGNVLPRRGVPLAAIGRWDTGVQVRAANDFVEGTGAVTLGTLANPLWKDDNGGPQIAGRLAFHPVAGLILGASASHGPFLATSTVRAANAGDPGPFTQDAWGADAEYSSGYYVVRMETILSRWTLPMVRAPFIDHPLDAAVISVEGRYKIVPGLYAAARVEHLGFSTITGSAGPRTWDAPVTRVETGAGYSIQRNVLLKFSYQFDKRDGGRVPKSHLVATEVVFWF